MVYTNNKLRIIYGDATLGLETARCHYIFSYEKGGLESLLIDSKEWLYRVPKPTFWRATTDNDRGNGFSEKSAAWLASDMFLHLKKTAVEINGKAIELPISPINNRYSNREYADKVKIIFAFETNTVPTTQVSVAYTATPDGNMAVALHYTGNPLLPDLPVFGFRMVMPTAAVAFDYAGLSGETYPDRMAAGEKGIYHVEGMLVTPYLVPQESGMHVQTDWLKIIRNSTQNNADHHDEPFSLMIKKTGKAFNFSCLPYTAEELENATHIEELPLARRTVLCIDGAVRGIGGIDSWGADVEEAYHIPSGEDIDYSFAIVPTN